MSRQSHNFGPIYKSLVPIKTIPNSICPICFDPIKKETAKPVTCRHLYCKDCLKQWIHYKNTCPVCRAPFKEITINYYIKLNHFSVPIITNELINFSDDDDW